MEHSVFDTEFTKWLIQLGVGGAIAGIIFFFYRKDVKQYTELWKAQADLNAQQTAAMMMLVEKNTTATVQNTEVLKALHRRVDRLDILRLTADEAKLHEERRTEERG